jgi:hypothetical protein
LPRPGRSSLRVPSLGRRSLRVPSLRGRSLRRWQGSGVAGRLPLRPVDGAARIPRLALALARLLVGHWLSLPQDADFNAASPVAFRPEGETRL